MDWKRTSGDSCARRVIGRGIPLLMLSRRGPPEQTSLSAADAAADAAVGAETGVVCYRRWICPTSTDS